jgi:hypothetical protein
MQGGRNERTAPSLLRRSRLKRRAVPDETSPAGHVEVGMNPAWAIARRAALWIGTATALVGCAPEVTPSPLLGRWYSDDERFDGRTLEIDPQWIRFMRGQQELGAIEVRAVTQEGSGDGPIRFEIEGVDREGQDTTLAFEMELRPRELLRLETQREPWRRTPRVLVSEAKRQPWRRKAGAPASGGKP